jgi:hypothetical protein
MMSVNIYGNVAAVKMMTSKKGGRMFRFTVGCDVNKEKKEALFWDCHTRDPNKIPYFAKTVQKGRRIYVSGYINEMPDSYINKKTGKPSTCMRIYALEIGHEWEIPHKDETYQEVLDGRPEEEANE